jgi:predicted O-methyltransferase YrrM
MIRGSSKIQQVVRFAPKYAYGLAASAYLFSLGALREKHRFFIWQLCKHFGWNDHDPVPLLPAVPAARILDARTRVLLPEPVARGGNVSTVELAVINGLVQRAQAQKIFEIGTFDGRSSLNMLLNAADSATVHTLDLPPDRALTTELPIERGDVQFIQKSESGERWKKYQVAGRIRQLFGDSATFDFSPFHGQMDFIFVDGSHSYQYVRNDTVAALNLCSPNGAVILWHDYDGAWPAVTVYLNELLSQDPRFRQIKRIEGTSLAILCTTPALEEKIFRA